MTVIKNPTADQLEAGGIIRRGTYCGQPITGWVLRENDHGGALLVGGDNGHPALVVRPRSCGAPRLTTLFTVTEYEPPPKPEPWEEPYDGWVMYEGEDGEQYVAKARRFRKWNLHPITGILYEGVTNIRRVNVTEQE